MSRPMMEFTKRFFGDRTIVGAEIGVFRGEHAEEMLLRLPNLIKLYLVDPYENYPEYHEKYNFHNIRKEAEQKLNHYADRIVWIISKFEYNLIPELLDFIYIVGNHAYSYVKKDIEIAETIVRPGGIIGGHDYNYAPHAVKQAVDEHCTSNIDFTVKHTDWWYVRREFIWANFS